MPGHRTFRFAFYLPVMLPMTVVPVLCARIDEPNYGLLNSTLNATATRETESAVPYLSNAKANAAPRGLRSRRSRTIALRRGAKCACSKWLALDIK